MKAEEQIELEFEEASCAYWLIRLNRVFLEGNTAILCEIEDTLEQKMERLLDKKEQLLQEGLNVEQQVGKTEKNTNI